MIMVFKDGMVTHWTLARTAFMLDFVVHTNPQPGGGEDGAEKQGILLPHLHVHHEE